MKVKIDKEQAEELRAAIVNRLAVLDRLRKRLVENRLSTADIDGKIELLRGDDDTAGLLDLLDEQVTMFETGKFEGLDLGPTSDGS